VASTLTTFDGLLKERYLDSSIVEKLMYPENVLFGLMKKGSGMVGDNLPIPILYGNPQGVASPFATAQTNASLAGGGGNVQTTKWNITTGDYHAVIHIGDKVLMASRTNQGAFLEDKRIEIDGLYETAAENLSIYLWGNGGQALGRIGVINSTGAAGTVTLTQTADIANFENLMSVVASANDGSDAAHTLRAGSDQIEGISRSDGILTFDDTTDITSLSANDYLFREGDFFGDQGVIVIRGVQSFVTATKAPPALWGVTAATRASDPERFAGCRVDTAFTAGKSYEERITILFSQMTGRFKAKAPTHVFLHPEDHQVLATQLSGRGIRPLQDSSTKFGYSKIEVATSGGTVGIYADRHCPKGTAFALRLGDWGIDSMGELLHPQNGDGLTMLRRSTATDYEYRLISYPLAYCRAPKNSGRVSLS
jgi:hypothetical protein